MKKLSALLLAAMALVSVFSCGKEDPYVIITPQPVVEKPEPKPDLSSYGLGDLAAMQGIKLGVAFNYQKYTQDPQVREILTREFKSVTCENEMKHSSIVRWDGVMAFGTADQMVQWAKEAGAELFGHVLGWHSQQQVTYLKGLADKAGGGKAASEAIDAAFKDYVFRMIEHFDAYAWDVVNETFADGANGAFRTKGGENDFIWGNYYASTKDWVDKAFAYATEASAKYGKSPVLYINDYNLETDQSKRRGLCNYAKGNPQVTGVATQMHLDMSTPDLKNKIEASLKDLVATGKMVRIAELDIKCTDETAQADLFKFIFQKYIQLVPEAQRGGITFWGINDKDSWVGENHHALLWKGQDYEKKKGYEAIYAYLYELNGLNQE